MIENDPNMHERPAEIERGRSPAALAALGGAGLALVSLPLARLAGPPYLGGDGVNGWLIAFAAGLLAALFATPFLIERSLRARLGDRDARWERALLLWGLIAVGVLVLGVVAALGGGIGGDSLAGSAGLLAALEAAVVIGTLIVWLLSV